MNNQIIIAVDAMGGENSPKKIIDGIIHFSKNKSNIFYKIFGKKELIKECIDKKLSQDYYEIINTDEIVKDEDSALSGAKNKNTSMWLAVESVKKKESNIVISAGNTGVLFVIAKLNIEMIENIDKPALSALWPNKNGMNVVLDLGANVECNEKNLIDFSIMGSSVFKALFPDEDPKVALLNIGSESIKGNETIKNTHFNIDTAITILNNNETIPSIIRDQLLVQGAGIVMDPITGHILAMIGGREEILYRDHFNRATQAKRQPGSVFKPFIYLSALENGYTPTTQLLNQPLIVFIDDTTQWNPQNHDGSTGLLTTLREGLRRSLNLISVRIVQELVTPREIIQNAKDFGISTYIRPVDAIALGVSEVIPIEIVAAYSAIANNGIYTKPITIKRIEDRHGRVIKDFFSESREVQDEASIFILRDMMKSIIDGGTGGSLRWKYKFYAPTAGKTGTTNSKADAWFVGFTPQLTIGIWVGMDDPSISLGDKQFGSTAALPIFANTIKDIYKLGEFERGDETIILSNKKDWTISRNVTNTKICMDTFEKASIYCPNTMKELYLPNTKPKFECKEHSSPFSRFPSK